MIREFLTATFCMMRWKIFQWMKFLLILQIQENWAGRNFITNSHVYDCPLRKQKCRLKSTTNGWRHFGQSEQRKSSVLFPIQSEKWPDSGVFVCDLWKNCIMHSSRKQITEMGEGEGMVALGYTVPRFFCKFAACGFSLWPKHLTTLE